MTVKTYRRLWCDRLCGSWVGEADMPGDTAEWLRERARRTGWRRTRKGRDICPDCWAEGER